MAQAFNIDRSLPTTPAAKETRMSESCCHRCGGFLVKERCIDYLEGQCNYAFWANRCIQCGDLVDEVTLRNRAKRLPTQVIDTADPLGIIQAMEQAA